VNKLVKNRQAARCIVEEEAAEEERRDEEERWRHEKAALRRAAKELAHRRAALEAAALGDLARSGGDDSFQLISKLLDDPSEDVRSAAVRSLYDINPNLTASFLNAALREATSERRRKIGAALAGAGLVSLAINNLTGESHENTYGALSLLFLMAKAGEVRPLMRLIENHSSIELPLAVIKLLALSGEPDIVPEFRRLAEDSSLPSELRSALMEAIFQISSKAL